MTGHQHHRPERAERAPGGRRPGGRRRPRRGWRLRDRASRRHLGERGPLGGRHLPPATRRQPGRARRAGRPIRPCPPSSED